MASPIMKIPHSMKPLFKRTPRVVVWIVAGLLMGLVTAPAVLAQYSGAVSGDSGAASLAATAVATAPVWAVPVVAVPAVAVPAGAIGVAAKPLVAEPVAA